MNQTRKRVNTAVVCFILVFSLLFVTPLFVQQVKAVNTVYYVSDSDGNDGDDGLSEANAWKTIGKVNTELNGGVINSGDDIYFNRGDVWTGSTYLNVKIGGSSSNWMIIGAYGSGDRPLFYNMSLGGYYAIWLREPESNYISIENLSFYNVTQGNIAAIGCTYNHNYIMFNNLRFNTTETAINGGGIFINQTYNATIQNCYFENLPGGAITFYGSYQHKVENGKILNCTGLDVAGAASRNCITIHVGADETPVTGELVGSNFLIKDCVMSGASEQGYDCINGENVIIYNCTSFNNAGSFKCGNDGIPCRNITIDKFFSYDENSSVNAFALSIGNSDEIIIRNSVWYNWVRWGMLVNQNITNLTFYNNDLIFGSDNTLTYGLVDIQYLTDQNLIFKNNIFYSVVDSVPTNRFAIYYQDAVQRLSPFNTSSLWSHNMWGRVDGGVGSWWQYNLSNKAFASWDALSQTDNEYNDIPELANVSSHDFTLNATSPCIDAGAWLTQTVGGGTGTTITLDDASYFMDGYGLIDGDIIAIGNDYNLMVTDIDYTANTITVDRSITWVDGESASLMYNGAAPDIGAEEYIYSFTDIVIPSDSDFDYAHGVRYGSGTTSSPYMICNWTIQNLTVYSTTKNFTIQNCTITYHINITDVVNSSLIEINDVSMDGSDSGKHSMCWIMVRKAGTITLHNNSFVNLSHSIVGW